MNDYLLSVILGIVEGLTEFLPVSSTAHLRICEDLLHRNLHDPYWKMYSVVIQLGAVLCVPIYFRGRIRKFISTFPQGERGDRTIFTHPLSLTLIAFVITAIPAWLLDKKIGDNLENLTVMGAALVIGGAIMWVVDELFVHPRILHMEEMGFVQAAWIGLCQILSAVFPGTSRSMSTIAAGEIAGMSRASALEFSFFLSIPTMLVATVYKLLQPFLKPWLAKVRHKPVPADVVTIPMDAQRWLVLAIGFVVSFLVAWVVVAWFMHWVRRRGFSPFAIYRIILGYVILRYAGGTLPSQELNKLLIIASLCWIPGAVAFWRKGKYATPVAIAGLISLSDGLWPIGCAALAFAVIGPREEPAQAKA